MNNNYEPKEREQIVKARESYSGRLLTDSQFDEAMSITGILEREIRKSGTFKEKLGDYAYAFARTEKFDSIKAEDTLRDLFKTRTGKSMNELRKALTEREAKLFAKDMKQDAYKNTMAQAYESGRDVGEMIRAGDKISFYRAYAHQATELANDIGITEVAARRLIRDEFQKAESRDFYEWGKEYEDKYYRPQIEAEQNKRKQSHTKNESHETQRSHRRHRS